MRKSSGSSTKRPSEIRRGFLQKRMIGRVAERFQGDDRVEHRCEKPRPGRRSPRPSARTSRQWRGAEPFGGKAAGASARTFSPRDRRREKSGASSPADRPCRRARGLLPSRPAGIEFVQVLLFRKGAGRLEVIDDGQRNEHGPAPRRHFVNGKTGTSAGRAPARPECWANDASDTGRAGPDTAWRRCSSAECHPAAEWWRGPLSSTARWRNGRSA